MKFQKKRKFGAVQVVKYCTDCTCSSYSVHSPLFMCGGRSHAIIRPHTTSLYLDSTFRCKKAVGGRKGERKWERSIPEGLKSIQLEPTAYLDVHHPSTPLHALLLTAKRPMSRICRNRSAGCNNQCNHQSTR